MYLNDLENFIISSGVNTIDLEIISEEVHVYIKLLILLYAEDNFEKALDNFHEYCTLWKLKINITKANVVIFNSKRNRNLSFSIGGKTISKKYSYKYLGFISSKSESFLNAK